MRLVIYREKTSSWSDSYGSGHISVLALADEGEELYITKKDHEPLHRAIFSYSPHAPIAITALHLKSQQGIEKNWGDEEDQAFNNLVTFQSPVSLYEFLRELSKAGYDTNKNYHAIKNNCVHATLKALEIAKIDFKVVNTYSCKHLVLFFWCPTNLVTPKELMAQLKTYKQELIADKQKTKKTQVPSVSKSLKME